MVNAPLMACFATSPACPGHCFRMMESSLRLTVSLRLLLAVAEDGRVLREFGERSKETVGEICAKSDRIVFDMFTNGAEPDVDTIWTGLCDAHEPHITRAKSAKMRDKAMRDCRLGNLGLGDQESINSPAAYEYI